MIVGIAMFKLSNWNVSTDHDSFYFPRKIGLASDLQVTKIFAFMQIFNPG
jgi:hypothetical protein